MDLSFFLLQASPVVSSGVISAFGTARSALPNRLKRSYSDSLDSGSGGIIFLLGMLSTAWPKLRLVSMNGAANYRRLAGVDALRQMHERPKRRTELFSIFVGVLA